MVDAKQTAIPEWAYEYLPMWAHSDGAKKMKPPDSVCAKGWGPAEAPSAEAFNWWMSEMVDQLADTKKWDLKSFLYQKKKIYNLEGSVVSLKNEVAALRMMVGQELRNIKKINRR